MVASNATNPSLGTVNIPHEGPEEYRNIWQKVRSMWSYVYDNYYEKYDWFHIGGDDLYLVSLTQWKHCYLAILLTLDLNSDCIRYRLLRTLDSTSKVKK